MPEQIKTKVPWEETEVLFGRWLRREFTTGECTEIVTMAKRVYLRLPRAEGNLFSSLLKEGRQEMHALLGNAKSKGALHKRAHDLRAHLVDYFETPVGFGEHFRVDLPIGKRNREYGLTFSNNSLAQKAVSFWERALNNGRRTVVALTEPPFVREALHRRFYARDFRENGAGRKACERVRRLMGIRADARLEIAYHYIAIAEVRGTMALMDYFHKWAGRGERPRPQFKSARECSGFEDVNFILMGTTRANSVLKKLEDSHQLGIHLRTEHVEVDHPSDAELASLKKGRPRNRNGVLRLRDWSRPNQIYVVVTRAVEERVVTLVASNHGLATQCVCEQLCDDAAVEKLIRWAILDRNWKGFPSRFQILFSVVLDDKEERAVSINPMIFRSSPLA
jgi:hypothetical protein